MFEAIIAMGVIGWALVACAIIALFGSVLKFKSSGGASFVWFLLFIAFSVALFKDPLLSYSAAYTSPTGGLHWAAIGAATLKLGLIWLVGGAVTGFFYWLSFVKDVSNAYNAARVSWLAKLKDDQVRADVKTSAWSDRAQTVIAKVLAVGHRDTSVFAQFGDNTVGLNTPRELRELVSNSHRPMDAFCKIDWSATTDDVGEPPQEPEQRGGTASYDERNRREQVLADYEQAKVKHAFGKASVQATLLNKLEASVREVLPPRAGNFKAAILFSAAVWPVTALSLIFADMLRHLWDWAFELARSFFDACSRKTFGEV